MVVLDVKVADQQQLSQSGGCWLSGWTVFIAHPTSAAYLCRVWVKQQGQLSKQCGVMACN
jgi:hypothetical protein